jgi:hypothetical protein
MSNDFINLHQTEPQRIDCQPGPTMTIRNLAGGTVNYSTHNGANGETTITGSTSPGTFAAGSSADFTKTQWVNAPLGGTRILVTYS